MPIYNCLFLGNAFCDMLALEGIILVATTAKEIFAVVLGRHTIGAIAVISAFASGAIILHHLMARRVVHVLSHLSLGIVVLCIGGLCYALVHVVAWSY